MTSQQRVSQYGDAIVPLSALLQKANAHWIALSVSGRINLESLNFDLALAQMEQARADFNNAPDSAEKIQPGPEVRTAHDLLLQSIRKHLESALQTLPGRGVSQR
jgi:hypothetical protein